MSMPLMSEQGKPPPIPMMSEPGGRRLTVLHIGTLNKPIGTDLGYSRLTHRRATSIEASGPVGIARSWPAAPMRDCPASGTLPVAQRLGDYVL